MSGGALTFFMFSTLATIMVIGCAILILGGKLEKKKLEKKKPEKNVGELTQEKFEAFVKGREKFRIQSSDLEIKDDGKLIFYLNNVTPKFFMMNNGVVGKFGIEMSGDDDESFWRVIAPIKLSIPSHGWVRMANGTIQLEGTRWDDIENAVDELEDILTNIFAFGEFIESLRKLYVTETNIKVERSREVLEFIRLPK